MVANAVAEELGRRLRGLRQARQYSLGEAARTLGISKSGLVRVEAGRTMPGIAYTIRLCKIYGARLEEAVSGLQDLAPPAVADDPDQPLLPGLGVSNETRK